MKKWTSLVLFSLACMIWFGGCSFLSDNQETESVAIAEESNEAEENNENEKEDKEYTIEYYQDTESTKPFSETTIGRVGEKVTIKTIKELGYSKEGYGFLGWKVYRVDDDKWLLKKKNSGDSEWRSLEGGKLPKGYSFRLLTEGRDLNQKSTDGVIRLYADWGVMYTIKYYPNVDSEDSEAITRDAVRGLLTDCETISDLGFNKEGYTFIGWRLYREIDDKWFLVNENGESGWYELEEGELPSGYSFSYREDGSQLRAPTTEGAVRLYAEWEEN